MSIYHKILLWMISDKKKTRRKYSNDEMIKKIKEEKNRQNLKGEEYY